LIRGGACVDDAAKGGCMSEETVIANQATIIANQERIIANQEKILANQATIAGNQGRLDAILPTSRRSRPTWAT
jgi:hypothetical protein